MLLAVSRGRSQPRLLCLSKRRLIRSLQRVSFCRIVAFTRKPSLCLANGRYRNPLNAAARREFSSFFMPPAKFPLRGSLGYGLGAKRRVRFRTIISISLSILIFLRNRAHFSCSFPARPYIARLV